MKGASVLFGTWIPHTHTTLCTTFYVISRNRLPSDDPFGIGLRHRSCLVKIPFSDKAAEMVDLMTVMPIELKLCISLVSVTSWTYSFKTGYIPYYLYGILPVLLESITNILIYMAHFSTTHEIRNKIRRLAWISRIPEKSRARIPGLRD